MLHNKNTEYNEILFQYQWYSDDILELHVRLFSLAAETDNNARQHKAHHANIFLGKWISVV